MPENAKAFDAPEQPEDVRKANLKGVAPATGTASGLAAAAAKGVDIRPKPENDGSTNEIAGGAPEPDLKGAGSPSEPKGAQAQPASFVSNGSVPANVGASNYGFVSSALLGATAEESHEIAKRQVETPQKQSSMSDEIPRIPRETIDRMNGAELRAAAFDRGYDLGTQRGNRGTRVAFIKAQNEDQNATGEGGGEGFNQLAKSEAADTTLKPAAGTTAATSPARAGGPTPAETGIAPDTKK